MELREYLRILLKNWWIIIPLMLIALTVSLVFSYAQNPVYEVTATYITTLDAEYSRDADSFIYAIDTLSNRQRIPVTYCEIFISGMIREQAYQLLGIDPTTYADASEYTVACTNLPETNVLFVAVQGPAPDVVMKLTEAIGIVGMDYTNNLFPFFPLRPLDPPFMTEDPVSPQIPQNAILGSALGLVLGVMAAFMLEYLRSPMDRFENMAIRNVELGVYNERYFRERFEQERNRAFSRLRPITMALIRVRPTEEFELLPQMIQLQLLRNVALMIQDSVNQGDIVTYLRARTFGVLMAETSGDEALKMFQKLHDEVRSKTFRAEGYVADFEVIIGLVASDGDEIGYKTMLERTEGALSTAEEKGKAIHLIRSSPKPFLISGDLNDSEGVISEKSPLYGGALMDNASRTPFGVGGDGWDMTDNSHESANIGTNGWDIDPNPNDWDNQAEADDEYESRTPKLFVSPSLPIEAEDDEEADSLDGPTEPYKAVLQDIAQDALKDLNAATDDEPEEKA